MQELKFEKNVEIPRRKSPPYEIAEEIFNGLSEPCMSVEVKTEHATALNCRLNDLARQLNKKDGSEIRKFSRRRISEGLYKFYRIY